VICAYIEACNIGERNMHRSFFVVVVVVCLFVFVFFFLLWSSQFSCACVHATGDRKNIHLYVTW